MMGPCENNLMSENSLKSMDILEIKYTIRKFDVAALCSHTRFVYELFPDGRITFTHFEEGNAEAAGERENGKAVREEERHSATAADFRHLCDEINNCVETADRMNEYIDDTAEEISITRPFSRVDTMDRGYGNAETDLGQIISDYVFGVGGMEW